MLVLPAFFVDKSIGDRVVSPCDYESGGQVGYMLPNPSIAAVTETEGVN